MRATNGPSSAIAGRLRACQLEIATAADEIRERSEGAQRQENISKGCGWCAYLGMRDLEEKKEKENTDRIDRTAARAVEAACKPASSVHENGMRGAVRLGRSCPLHQFSLRSTCRKSERLPAAGDLRPHLPLSMPALALGQSSRQRGGSRAILEQ